MKKKDWYENWFSSKYYGILYQDRDDTEAEQFIERLVKHLEPAKNSKMLDIACGEGRHAIQLAEQGFDVTGIDLSYESILSAKQAESNNLHFYVHDMRFPFYINYFDYSFNFFTSFGYFDKKRDHEMAAKSFAKGLKQGGTLVVDYLNANHVIKNLIPKATIQKGDYSFDITKSIVDNHIIKDIRFKDAEGNDMHFAERVATFTLTDFLSIFDKANLTLIETFGDYQLNKYDEETSPRLVMVFQK